MPKLLITAAKVIELAIPNQNFREEWITASAIKIAQENFILPVLGSYSDRSGLYDYLVDTETLAAEYKTLHEDYIWPALAFYVKYQITPDVFTQLTNIGLMSNSTDNSQTVSKTDKEVYRAQAKQDGDTLITAMLNYLNLDSNSDKFQEWSRGSNVQEQVNYSGGIIIRKKRRLKGGIYY
jgi:hypothetical protein